MKELKLCLHAGATRVDRAQLAIVNTPAPTETWCPVPHNRLLDEVERHLVQTGLRVTGEAHAITERDGGLRYFGLLAVETVDAENKGYSWVLGMRNSHDKTFPAALAAGNQVFVCDNLSFNGEIKLARRHTRFIERDLPQVVSRVVGQLTERWASLETRIDGYKERELTDTEAHDLTIKLLDARALNATDVPHVLKEYRAPSHPEFCVSRNAWRLFNAVTENAKGSNVFNLPARTEALHGVFDAYCGVVIGANSEN